MCSAPSAPKDVMRDASLGQWNRERSGAVGTA